MIISGALCALFLALGFLFFPSTKVSAEMKTSDLFSYNSLKYKSSVKYGYTLADGTTESRTGLLLYSYDSGTTADFNLAFSGVFSADMKAVNNGSSDGLKRYSLKFTDTDSQDTFSVGFVGVGNSTNVYVEVDGERAGVVYVTNGTQRICYGYSSIYNQNGYYTSVEDGGSAKIMFDPESMCVYVENDVGGNDIVWNFNQTSIDGRHFETHLSSFDSYTVSVVLEDVMTNTKGELYVFSFGGIDFSNSVIESVDPTLNVSLKSNAIVGRGYVLPVPVARDSSLNEISAQEIKVDVYNEQGDMVSSVSFADGEDSFVPPSEGKYYLFYRHKDGIVDGYYKITALREDEIDCVFDEWQTAATVGTFTTLNIPSLGLKTNLSVSDRSYGTSVSVRKDGAIVEGYEKVEGGFGFNLDRSGRYEIIFINDEFGVELKKEVVINVTDDIAAVKFPVLDEVVPVGTEFEIADAEVMYARQKYTSRTKLVYPSGKEATGKAVLSEVGRYTVVYDCVYEGKEDVYEKTFEVKETPASLFETVHGSVEYGKLNINNNYSGAIVTFENGGSLVYNKVIDLSDNTKDDILLEMVIDPSSLAQMDFAGMYVTFTDVHDESNYFTMRIRNGGTGPYTLIRAAAPGQYYTAWYYGFDWSTGQITSRLDNTVAHDYGGFVPNMSFTGEINAWDFDESVLRIYYDNEEKALYSYASWMPANTPKLKICDFDDENCFSNKLWSGFNTGEVRMSISTYGVDSSARVALFNIDGYRFDTRYSEDTDGPEIVTVTGELPAAQVGKSYRLPEFRVTDASAVIWQYSEVYYGAEKIAVEDGAFTPSREGTYTIVYCAADSFGNRSQKTFAVKAKEVLPSVSFEWLGIVPERVELGARIQLPEVVITNQGAGEATCSIHYGIFGEELTEATDKFIDCTRTGILQIVYTVTDYVGNQTSKTITVEVYRSGEPVFDEDNLNLPVAFFASEEYVFPTYYATYYNKDLVKYEIPAKITVYDGAETPTVIGNDGVYVPAVSDQVKTARVSVLFQGKGSQPVEITREIPVISLDYEALSQEEYQKNLFVYNNATVTAKNNGILFENVTADENMAFTFSKPVDCMNLDLLFNLSATANRFGKLVITLTDSENGRQAIRLVITPFGDKLQCSMNGNAVTAISGSATDPKKTEVEIVYNSASGEFSDGMGLKLGTPVTSVYGEEFNGFSSGKVYVNFEVCEIAGNSAVSVAQINNQKLTFLSGDNVAPMITVNGSCTGTFALGDTIVIPSAHAYDVISRIGEVMVEVKNPDGNVVLNDVADKDYSIVCDRLGEYTVEYRVSEIWIVRGVEQPGNTKTKMLSFVVANTKAPEIIFDSELPERALAGATLVLPAYRTVSNSSSDEVDVFITVVAPDGKVSTVTDGRVVLEKYGLYQIVYHLRNSDGNVACVTLKVISGREV